jgi:SAM-dependent methyltransferase
MDDTGATSYQPIYEGFYARAGQNFSAIPWAALAPHPSLVDWLGAQHPPVAGARALVVACGLGDDAEYVAGRGYRTAAFDFSPTAIARCRGRFPETAVEYRIADVEALPDEWVGAFDLVVEIRTLQSIPREFRSAAADSIAGSTAPGGRVFVHGFGAADGEEFDSPPWPVTPSELARLSAAGLDRIEYVEEPINADGPPHIVGRAVSFTAVYGRPANRSGGPAASAAPAQADDQP